MSKLGLVFRKISSIHALSRARSFSGFRILILGVFLRDKPNLAPEIVASTGSLRHSVHQRWASIGKGEHRRTEMRAHTVLEFEEVTPKFTIINQLLREFESTSYDFVIVTDDDIELPVGFIDDFIGLQAHYGFALAQPARSQQSNVDHAITLESHARIARETRFVEIGPIFSVAASAFSYLMPFDESFYMGWGLDYVWPAILHDAGLKQGVIDIAPVHHRFRPVASTYSGEMARQQMAAGLAGRKVVAAHDMQRPVRTHWW